MNEASAQPFLPLTRPTIDEETIAGVAEVMRSGWITSGPQMKAFEAALSTYFGGRPVRAFNSGTATLEVALALCNIGPGDEVITTPLSWVATANVILRAGAKPVFVDIDPVTRNIDLTLIEAAITPNTRAIMPVDLAGLPVDRDQLYAIAKKHSLRVIEDAAQSMGARWKGACIGALGDLVSISFHPNKNMTTSEGGCLVLNNEQEAKLAEQHRLQGVVRDADGGMEVDIVGGKFNMTDIAARIGLSQLKQLDSFNLKRTELAQHYFDCFAKTEVGLGGVKQGESEQAIPLGLPVADFTDSNWHMFQITVPFDQLNITRGDFIRAMQSRGIGVGVHYPAIHLFKAYRRLGFKEGDFPHAERIGRETVTLPLFPAMQFNDVDRVCTAIREIISETTSQNKK